MPRKSAKDAKSRDHLVELSRAHASRRLQFLGAVIFAQATGSYGPNPLGDAAKGIAELFVGHPNPPAPPEPGEYFGTVKPAFCTYVSFKPEIPEGMRAVIEVDGNEQAVDPKYGAIEIFVTPGWTPSGGEKPPGDPRTTFGGDGGCWVRGPGRLTIHLATDSQLAPKVTVRLEKMP